MGFNQLWERVKHSVKQIFLPIRQIYQTFGHEPAISDTMERELELWYSLYVNKPPWANELVRPLGLPAAVVREFSRVIASELSVSLDGGERAVFLEQQLSQFLPRLQQQLTLGLALGGLAIKPYVSGGRLCLDAAGASGFYPLRFDEGGRCVAGVFKSPPLRVERRWYVRLECHELQGSSYIIRNRAFSSSEDGICGAEVPLSTVPQLASVLPEVCIQNVERPLFGYFAVPGGNGVDISSQMGASVYAGATVDLMRQADEQWERFLYEFQSAERRVFATPEALRGPVLGGQKNPLALDRLYVQMPYDSETFFHEFSPELRNTGYYEGLQAILRRIEFNVGLAYGDLSDPTTVEKTATEVIAAKSRKYNTVQAMERSLKAALEGAVYGMDVYATLYELAPRGSYDLYIDFDDSILTDGDAQRERDRQDVRDGLMQAWEYRVKWYGETEEVARRMTETQAAPFGFS